MTILKKAAAAIMSAVITAALCAAPAAAADTIKTAVPGIIYKLTMPTANVYANYNINMEKDGELVVKVDSDAEKIKITLCDENDTLIYPEGAAVSAGMYDVFTCELLSDSTLKGSADITYKLVKGSYSLCFVKTAENGEKFRFSLSYPSGAKKPKPVTTATKVTTSTTTTTKETKNNTTSSEASLPAVNTDNSINAVSALVIHIRPGETVSLGAIADNSEVPAAWESSDSNVASVNTLGTVTAVSHGTAVITGKTGKNTVAVVIRVD